jgi:hypothetical protein
MRSTLTVRKNTINGATTKMKKPNELGGYKILIATWIN